ncbi:MAG: M15 family peptidase [Planctomycetia bacterium]|nr:M15 family peptidase [Planctomycetia bacterium]
MFKFGAKSTKQLLTCHQVWQDILNKAIEIYDFTILEGYRGELRQNHVFKSGVSKLPFPLSSHNKVDKKGNPESLGVDLAPFPLYWDSDREQFLILAGIIIGLAFGMGYKVIWGGDWDSDYDFKDQKFNDLAHFTLILN